MVRNVPRKQSIGQHHRTQTAVTITNYEIIEQIAEAPTATVYKARHKKNPERLLVLKLWKTASTSEYQQAQFRQRIEHLKVLNDPLVIIPRALGSRDGACFIIQDYFDGVPLNRLTGEHVRLSLNDFFTIACRLSKALDIVHEAGI